MLAPERTGEGSVAGGGESCLDRRCRRVALGEQLHQLRRLRVRVAVTKPVCRAADEDREEHGDEREEAPHSRRLLAHRELHALPRRCSRRRGPNERLADRVAAYRRNRGRNDMHLDVRPLRAEPDHVALGQRLVSRYAASIEKGAVRAAAVAEEVAVALGDDLGVSRRDVEIGVRIEAQVALEVATERDDRLLEAFAVSAARPGEDAQLDRHQPLGAGDDPGCAGAARVLSPAGATFCAVRTTNQTAVATSATSSTTAITVPVWRRFGETVGEPAGGVGAVEKSVPSGGVVPNDGGTGGIGAAASGGVLGGASGRDVRLGGAGGATSEITAAVCPVSGSGKTRCPTSSVVTGGSRREPSKRAAMTVMLSGPPFSFARSISRLHAETRSASSVTMRAISSLVTWPERPSLQRTSASPRRTF